MLTLDERAKLADERTFDRGANRLIQDARRAAGTALMPPDINGLAATLANLVGEVEDWRQRLGQVLPASPLIGPGHHDHDTLSLAARSAVRLAWLAFDIRSMLSRAGVEATATATAADPKPDQKPAPDAAPDRDQLAGAPVTDDPPASEPGRDGTGCSGSDAQS